MPSMPFIGLGINSKCKDSPVKKEPKKSLPFFAHKINDLFFYCASLSAVRLHHLVKIMFLQPLWSLLQSSEQRSLSAGQQALIRGIRRLTGDVIDKKIPYFKAMETFLSIDNFLIK